MKHVKDHLFKPFTAKLSSALYGSRLLRSLLEVIASQAAQSLKELALFISCTLKFQLTKTQSCDFCKSRFDRTQ
jgi:hypothetical protein